MWASWLIALALLFPAISGAAATEALASARASVVKARTAFLNAVHHEQWEDVSKAIWTVTLPSSEADELTDELAAQIRANNASGFRWLGESVRTVEFLADGRRILAFLRVTASYENPIHPQEPTWLKETVFAMSQDEGQTWKFNVVGCFGQAHVKYLFPSYPGFPEVAEK